MQALIVIDAQNEFSPNGKRPVHGYGEATRVIMLRVTQARNEGWPIAWVRHHNKPTESPAFQPGTWGAEFMKGLGPNLQRTEVEFQKNVYGAFTGTNINIWLRSLEVDKVLLVGFYTHGCLSTTAREAIMHDLQVSVDPDATSTCDLVHEFLGIQSAEEVKRSTLLHLAGIGVNITPIQRSGVNPSFISGNAFDLFW